MAYFLDKKNPDSFNFLTELGHAAINKTLPDHIANELHKIQAADLIILQFPMYWFGVPAIMKGWLDVCFPDHIAFDISQEKWLDDGLFKVCIKLILNHDACAVPDTLLERCFSSGNSWGSYSLHEA